ncbi:hypothetical protein GBA52_011503 [Prunus armeniaca]|nr:hypothetical protein GBA52_011503 [Prunus armeniaca]
MKCRSPSVARLSNGISLCLPESVKEIDFSADGENGSPSTAKDKGKRWAILMAGSNGYYNYRHQADICHAYQILKKDERTSLFSYTLILHTTRKTLDKVSSSTSQRAMTGGSGKVLKSGPNDQVFIYYADDGSAGLLGMPCEDDSVSAKDLIHVLKKKHLCKGFKSMSTLLYQFPIYFESLARTNYFVVSMNLERIVTFDSSDSNDLRKETLEKQYERDSYASIGDISSPSVSRAANQRDTNLLYFQHKLRIYKKYRGHLSTYGMKYTQAIANICNAGVTMEKMVAASDQACSKKSHV